MPEKPLILLDVDGVLNPFGAWAYLSDPEAMARRRGFDLHQCRVGNWRGTVALSRWHAEVLASWSRLADFAWATTWNDDANVQVAPRLGLPILPVVPVTYVCDDRIWWKASQVGDWLAEHHPGRNWLWLDDEVDVADGEYLNERDGVGKGAVFWVDPETGLTLSDTEQISDLIVGLT